MENIQEIKASEELTRRFLTWDIDPDSEDVIEVLRQMIEETDVFLEEDISICVEGTANRQNAATSDESSIDSSEEVHWGFSAEDFMSIKLCKLYKSHSDQIINYMSLSTVADNDGLLSMTGNRYHFDYHSFDYNRRASLLVTTI